MTHCEMISEISKIIERHKKIYEETGSQFNVFSIAGIDSDEVIICRIIAEFLNPKSSHYQGTKYLELFFNKVIKLEDSDVKNAKVSTEVVISNSRRIDILIETKNHVIPIEVKLYAPDQPSQCYDYVKYYENKIFSHGKFTDLYYLTLNGHLPSNESVTGKNGILEKQNGVGDEVIGYERIKIVSFSDHVINWLETCEEETQVVPIKEVLKQLIKSFKILTNQTEDNMKTEITNEILKSEDSFRVASEIANYIPNAAGEILCRVLKNFESKIIEAYGWEPCSDIEYKPEKVSGFPKIGFKMPDGKWFGIEIASRIYFGIKNEKPLKNDSFYFEKGGEWKYITWDKSDSKKQSPNFKGLNDALFSLATDKSIERFVDIGMEQIELFLKSKS